MPRVGLELVNTPYTTAAEYRSRGPGMHGLPSRAWWAVQSLEGFPAPIIDNGGKKVFLTEELNAFFDKLARDRVDLGALLKASDSHDTKALVDARNKQLAEARQKAKLAKPPPRGNPRKGKRPDLRPAGLP